MDRVAPFFLTHTGGNLTLHLPRTSGFREMARWPAAKGLMLCILPFRCSGVPVCNVGLLANHGYVPLILWLVFVCAHVSVCDVGLLWLNI